MRKSLSYRQKILLLLLGCFFIMVIVYIICALTIFTSIKKYKRENRSLREQYQAVESFVVNKDFYKAETIKNNKVSLKTIEYYVSNVSDKSLLYDFDRNLDKYGMKTSALLLNDNEIIEDIKVGNDAYTLQATPVSVTFDVKLSKLKSFIGDIKNKNLAIQTISITPDDSNNLVTGNLTFNQNSILGASRDIKDPSYNGRTGVSDLFDN